MFNFKVFKNGLTDSTLSKNEFRVLCLMLNQSSFFNSKTFEMYNGYIQDTLGISERNVRDVTKSLEQKGYIKKEVSANSYNRNANTYTIIDDKDGDKNVTLNKDLGAESCTEKCAENCPPNENKINNNNKGFNNIISTVSISPLDRVKPLNGDSVNSSKGDSVDKGVKQQNKMNEMSDKGAIGVKSAYGSTSGEQVKPLMECRPAPAPQRSTEDDMEFNKAVDKRKDFLFNGTKCLFDFEKGFKDLAIAKENVWKFKPWSDDAKKKWTDDFNKWWVNSKPFIYKSYLRTLDYMNETLNLNGRDRFEEMCSMIEE